MFNVKHLFYAIAVPVKEVKTNEKVITGNEPADIC